MQFTQPPADHKRLDIGVSGQHEVAIKRLEEIRPAHVRARPRQKRQQRMIAYLVIAVVKQPVHRRGRFRHHAGSPVGYGILHETLTGKRGIGPAGPEGLPALHGHGHEAASHFPVFGHGVAIRRALARQGKGKSHDGVLVCDVPHPWLVTGNQPAQLFGPKRVLSSRRHASAGFLRQAQK